MYEDQYLTTRCTTDIYTTESTYPVPRILQRLLPKQIDNECVRKSRNRETHKKTMDTAVYMPSDVEERAAKR